MKIIAARQLAARLELSHRPGRTRTCNPRFWSPLLVLCPVNNSTKSLELPEDGIRGGGPEEGPSVAIVVLHELVDLGDELGHAGERPPADGALGDERKPALDLVEPRGVGRREVEVVARMPGQP